MKRFLAIIATLCLLGTISAFASSFIDVPEDAYYAEAAARMNEKGILTGYGDNRYNGNDNITRAQMAVVAVRLLDKEAEAKKMTGATMFDDFNAALDWATGYVNYASAAKIINGDGDGKYRPNDSVKYEEVVKIIVCVLGLDKDVKIDPNDWSKEYIEAADKAGLLNGLIGVKGEAMKRSDIAVICDASISFLENDKEESSEDVEVTTAATTEEEEKPKVTTVVTTEEEEEPEETTVATTKKEEKPKVTTAVTTKKEEKPKVTTAVTTKEEEPEETTAVVTTEEEEEPEDTTVATTKKEEVEVTTSATTEETTTETVELPDFDFSGEWEDIFKDFDLGEWDM